MSALHIDHLVVSAERLEDGVAYVEDTLDVTLAPGGTHMAMGTHNRLLGLGDVYLEVIAIDPTAPPPRRKRWFDLDRFRGPPRLTNWVARTDDLDAALALAPDGTGIPTALSRGDLHWTIAISADGTLPFGGGFPGLIDWGDAAHPTTRLPESGCRVQRFCVNHPKASELGVALGLFDGGLNTHLMAGAPGFRAEIATPAGVRVLR